MKAAEPANLDGGQAEDPYVRRLRTKGSGSSTERGHQGRQPAKTNWKTLKASVNMKAALAPNRAPKIVAVDEQIHEAAQDKWKKMRVAVNLKANLNSAKLDAAAAQAEQEDLFLSTVKQSLGGEKQAVMGIPL